MGIKGIAIILIVISHCYPILMGSGWFIRILRLYGGVLGRVGCLLFICCTGVLSALHESADLKLPSVKVCGTSLKHSLMKMYPLVLFSESVMFVLYVLNGKTEGLLTKFLSHVLLVQSYIPENVNVFAYTLNEPLWYLSSMTLIWFIKPIISEIVRKFGGGMAFCT